MKIKMFCCVLVGILLSATSCYAQYIDGKVINTEDDSITVQLELGNPFSPGNRVDLTYKAGGLEVLLGQYEITAVKGNVFVGKIVSQKVPPSKNMKVKVIIALEEEEYGTNPFEVTAEDLKKLEGVGLDEMLEDDFTGGKFGNINDKGDPDFSVNGKVTKVLGKEVVIELEEDRHPQIGYQVDLFFVTSQGLDLPVGKWRVTRVKGKEVTARCYDCEMPAREGLKAVITGKVLDEAKE